MNFHSPPSTVSNFFRPSADDQDSAVRFGSDQRPAMWPLRQRPRVAAYVAFFITVFASMAAAAALAIHDIPLVVGAL